MNARRPVSKLVMILSGLLSVACLLPGMIPLNRASDGPMPVMEEDPDALLQTLSEGDWTYLQALAEEQYTEEDFAAPGTLTFTVRVPPNTRTYFNYGWCTTTTEILQQNFEHIDVRLYFNGDELGEDVVHTLTYTRPDGLVCLDFGVMLSDWPQGEEYELEAVARFDERINDGLDDYDAGEYIYRYRVTVE
jgi:hypothetical protein